MEKTTAYLEALPTASKVHALQPRESVARCVSGSSVPATRPTSVAITARQVELAHDRL